MEVLVVLERSYLIYVLRKACVFLIKLNFLVTLLLF